MMTRIKKITIGIILIGAAASAALPVKPAHAEVYGDPGTMEVRGGVNFDGYCQALSNQGATLYGQWPYTAGSWKCYNTVSVDLGEIISVGIPWTTYSDIDADAACQWTYGDSNLEADFVRWDDPSSIVCVDPYTYSS